MTQEIELNPGSELAPEPPPHGPVVWMRANLFSSIASTILTVIVGLLLVTALRGMLSFVFAEGRRWDAVFVNARLLMVQAYPAEGDLSQFHRIWLSVGSVTGLAGLSMAIARTGGRISPNRVMRDLTSLGTVLLVAGILSRFDVLDLLTFNNPFDEAVFSGSVTIWMLMIGAVTVVGSRFAKSALGERGKEETLPLLIMAGFGAAIAVASLWIIKLPLPIAEADGGGQTLEPIANSTRFGWLSVFLAAVVGYWIGVAIRDRVRPSTARAFIVAAWVLLLPVVTLAVLRDPAIDYAEVVFKFPDGTFWVGVIFAVIGTAILVYLSRPDLGESGRVTAGLILVLAVVSWLFPMATVIRVLLMLLAIMALGAPTFGGGEGASRGRYLGLWLTTVLVTAVLITWISSPTSVVVQTNFFIGGLMLSFMLAIFAIALSFPLGVLFALGRTSSMPIFRMLSVGYIEIVRGVPLITWLLVSVVVFPIFLPVGVAFADVVKVLVFVTLFSAAYLAENVRGGLQSIPKGQIEAAKAVGMTTTQTTVFIVLPQALRAVIPALVGQVIAIFKDTSLVAIVGLFDFLSIAQKVVPLQTNPFNTFGSIREALLFAALVYWVFTFSVSRASLQLEKKLGVGQR